MTTLRIVLGDQLSREISALRGLDRTQDMVLMAEVSGEATAVKRHQQKIVLVLSAMRHFADTLRADGVPLEYIPLDAEGNTGSLTGEVRRALSRHAVDRIVVTEPGEWRVREMFQTWEKELDIPVEIRPDNRFLCSREEFTTWAKNRNHLRMEYFYREMRRKTGWLMDGTVPEGGKWNYDTQNRKALPQKIDLPPVLRFPQDTITHEVMGLVEKHFGDHFGALEPFAWGVTRQDALQALENFIVHGLPQFGDYQDAMKSGEDFLFHSLLSPYLNIGLLNPWEVCKAALDAYQKGDVPLPSVEGFLRQIMGWREYIRGIYWLKMPDYAQSNFFEAHRPLPEFYWTGETTMHCMREAITATRRNAYAHHIQRLMVTGNFALLAGINPAEVEEWYLIVYADAFEWVELPNVHGMALHADGGMLASKPYAASGAYIHRMSDYCLGCAFDPKRKEGEKACPFNYLYWYFLIVNQEKLKDNPRMLLIYATLERMSDEKIQRIRNDAETFLSGLEGISPS